MQLKLVMVFLFFAVVESGAEKVTTFISQSYVDSLVDRALYIFNSVSDPGSGVSTERAIEYAKQIATKLREIASDDVNKKYILWKAGELEAQIYLEESGLLMEKELWRQKTSNEIVFLYNTETGKACPDFRLLWSYHTRLKAVDTSQAQRLEKSILSRASGISVEILSSVELSLKNGNYESARQDLAYCETNRQYLAITAVKLASLQAKLLSDFSLSKERVLLREDFDSLTSAITSNRLPDSRVLASKVRNRLDGLKTSMMQLEWTRFNDEYFRLYRKIGNKEDSLVALVQARLKSKGIVAAEELLDTVRLYGISHEKIARIDRLILEEAVARKKQEPPLVQISIDQDTSESTVLSDLLVTARERAASQKDSIESRRQENARMTQIAEVRRDRMRVAAQQQQKRLQERKQEDSRRAQQELVTIYTLIENGRIEEAAASMEKVKDLLEKNLSEKEFRKVSLSISSRSKKTSE